jgi:integrase
MGLKDLPETLYHVRNFFCFCCFTGLRFGDLITLTKTAFKGDYLEVRTHKTKDTLKIPLTEKAKNLIAIYRENDCDLLFPFGLSNQQTNDALKLLASKAEMNELIESTNYKGVNRITTINKKHELVCTHTARRTFITLSLEKGIRPEVVMSVTGHKDYRTFQKYIKLTDSVKMTEVLAAWN